MKRGNRTAVLAAAGVALIVVAWLLRPALVEVGEGEARRLVSRGELIGLTLTEAGQKLQHRTPATRDGAVVLGFEHARRWKAGPLTLDVRDGRETAATWGAPAPGEE